MSARSEAQWEEALFPEAAVLFESDLARILHTLDALGLRNAREARAQGFVCVRAAHGHAPGLWVHKNLLGDLEPMVEHVAERRAERERREQEYEAEKRRRISNVVDAYIWTSDEERSTAIARLLLRPLEGISKDSLDALVIPRRLSRALATVPGLRVHGESIVVAGDLEGTLFGRSVRQRTADLGVLALTDTLRALLVDAEIDRFTAEAERAARELRAVGDAARGAALQSALDAIETAVEPILHTLDGNTSTRDSIEDRLVSLTSAKLADTRQENFPSLVRLVERRARELVWAALVDESRTSKREWSLSGDHWHPSVSFRATISLNLVGAERTLVSKHRKELPKELRTLAPDVSIDSLLQRIDAFVAEERDEAQSNLERVGQQLAELVGETERISGLDIVALEEVVREELEFDLQRPRQALRRIRARVDELRAKAVETRAVHALLSQAHFVNYAAFFEDARRLDRKLILYVGPTNSGKTFHALNALAEGESGVYLAPLRLLALEGQEELEKRGKKTSFLTGEERDIQKGATFISSTIEMLDTTRPVDAVVVDEVQLLSDSDRGWAWSAAIIGAPAKSVIMTGSPDSVPLVKSLASYLGETLEIRTLERFTPLSVLDDTTSMAEIEPGTAVICFSRRDVLGLKEQLEARNSVSVIYGNLSPQVRREQARRFRSGETSVLVATDAIALGLNLPIRTVLFTTTWKWNGREETRLTPSEIRQIGGRAGRFGKHDAGFVGTLSRSDLDHVRAAFRDTPQPIPVHAQVRPTLAHVDTMSDLLESKKLRDLLDLFRRRMRFDDPLLSAVVPDELLHLASMADGFDLPLRDKFTFACAPVDTRNMAMMHQYGLWMGSFARGKRAKIDRMPPEFGRASGSPDPDVLFQAELRVKLLTVYAWLAYRYPRAFPDLSECDFQRDALNDFIERTLKRKGHVRRCTQCGYALPSGSSRSVCERCERRFRRRRR